MLAVERRAGASAFRIVAADSPEARRIVDLRAEAYPTMALTSHESRDRAYAEEIRLAADQPEIRRIATFRDGDLVASMAWFALTMNVRGAQVATSGLGSLAVALDRKRRGIARDCVSAYLDDAAESGVPLAALYAFRADFYAALGFAAGPKIDQYRVAPAALPDDPRRERVRRLGVDDVDALDALYARLQPRVHGLIKRERWRWDTRLTSTAHFTFGYAAGDGLDAYLTYEVQLGGRGTWNRNAIVILEFVYASPDGLAALLAFLRSQGDQFDAIVFNTFDPDFHVLFRDARNGNGRSLFPPVFNETNAQGIGLMYRVVDPAGFIDALREAAFGTLSATVRFTIAETALRPALSPLTVRFAGGHPSRTAEGTDAVEIALSIADFTAIMMGTVRLRSLVAYGRVVLSDATRLDALDAAFACAPPRCDTRF